MGDASAVAFVRIEGRADKSVVMIIRPDPLLRDAEFLQVDAGLPVERLGVAAREILGVVGGIGRDELSEGEAGGTAAAEEAADALERIHQLVISRFRR